LFRGAAEDYGSFGWVLGLADGTRLAHGFGTVHGHEPSSYRAEGYGAKAGALFLLYLFHYCDRAIPHADSEGGSSFHCDNEGLLKKLAVFGKYKNARQATCLHSEWDIVSAVHGILVRFPSLPRLVHVKGHQDDHFDLDELDLPTRMNIEADALATKALQGGTSQPIIPFDPSSCVMLTINGHAITRQLETTIQ
jgi:hypothetical protein